MSELKLNTPLKADEIDFRVQTITYWGKATILAYKDARVDMKRLDAIYGVDGWQRIHEERDGKLFCRVGVYVKDRQEWVWKEDVGMESNIDAAKGESSDAFKRACFNFGIGRELYDYPVIEVDLHDDEFKEVEVRGKKIGRATWKLKLKEWKWVSQFDDDGNLTALAARDTNGKVRFRWGEFKKNKETKDE